MTEAESADRPGPEVVLAVATALAERMGGAAPVAMICLDPQVLEYGRELIDKKESAGQVSLRQALEDIIQGQGNDCKLRIEEGEPFPMVRLVRDAGGSEFDSTDERSRKRPWSYYEDQSEAPYESWRSSGRRAPSVSLTKTSDDWSWRGSKKWKGEDWSSWSYKKTEWRQDWSSWGSDDYYHNYGTGQWSSYTSCSTMNWTEQAEETSGCASSSAGAPYVTVDQVTIYVIDNVPIVSIGKGTDFESNAAPLLQSAMQDHVKAESLYENCDQHPEARRLAKEARKRQIVSSLREIAFVRPRGREVPLAAGLQGKRSLMLALVFALCSQDKSCFDRCDTLLRSYALNQPFKRLMEESGLSE